MRTLTIGGAAHAPDGSGYYRFFLPYHHLGRNSHHIVGMLDPAARGEILPKDAAQLDVLAMQRPAGRVGLRQLERLAGVTKLVYECDDDMLRVERSGLPHLVDDQMRESIRRCLRIVDLITVSTPYLAGQVEQFNDNVVVLPNYVKASLLDWPRPRRERLTIGWAGGTSHLVDMVTVQEPLRDVLDAHPDVDMHFMGFDFSPLVGRECRWSNWEPDVGAYYKRIDFDIAIAPLADRPFNWSKSHIRTLEMAALGIPVVASNVLPYNEFVIDGKTGFLVSSPEEFARRLTELIHDADAREELGRNAREQARDHTIDEHWVEWEAAYEGLF